MSAFVDGDFSYPREIEGSGTRIFSQYNNADFILERRFVQEKNSYTPLPISSADYQYGAYLVEESEIKRDGYLVWFRRTYSTLPRARIENREVSFSSPGIGGFTGPILIPNGWNRYGKARPSTQFRNATVQISYTLGQPVCLLPTQILYNGAVVDYVGDTYTDDGKTWLGVTLPSTIPLTWILSDTARRWKGNIWERELVIVQ